jgi:hypothetical protein
MVVKDQKSAMPQANKKNISQTFCHIPAHFTVAAATLQLTNIAKQQEKYL